MMANVTLRLILMKVLECNLADWNSCWRGRRRVVDGAINSPEVKLDGFYDEADEIGTDFRCGLPNIWILSSVRVCLFMLASNI